MLHHLQEEINGIKEKLDPVKLQEGLQYTDMYGKSTTREKVFRQIRELPTELDLCVFHYGGHATSGSLELNEAEGKDTKGIKINGLAEQLGSIDSLQLVFLNGCSTRNQVKIFLENGIKAVIATSTTIDDELATIFSKTFYECFAKGDSIGTAYDSAKKEILSELEKEKILDINQSSNFFMDDEEEDDENQEEEVPWGLYYREENKSVLEWALKLEKAEPVPQPTTFFAPVEAFKCNRNSQEESFIERFDDLRELKTKVQVYFMHGIDRESPNGLFSRFSLSHIPKAYSESNTIDDVYEENHTFHKIVTFKESSTLKNAKKRLINALFEAFNLNPNNAERTLNHFASNARPIEGKRCVCIQFRVNSSAWKPYTKEFLTWFIEEFTDETKLPADSPDFIFFFSVIYDEQAKGGLMGRLLKRSPKDQILKTMKEFPDIKILNELSSVPLKDIDIWLDDKTEDVSVKEEKLKKYFSEKKEWEMIDVEDKLEKIIKEFNQHI